MIATPTEAIANVLNSRQQAGASDESLIRWLEHLKADVWKSPYAVSTIDGFIDAIQQTPCNPACLIAAHTN